MNNFDGVRVRVHSVLPCVKALALCIPKNKDARRHFFNDETGQVWGYMETNGLDRTFFVSLKVFNKLRNGNE